MSDAVMRKSYVVVVIRNTGQPMELTKAPDYQTALTAAKDAITNKNNTEVHVVESKYDEANKREKKHIVKILTRENAGGTSGKARGQKPAVTREVANQATKSIMNIVIAVTVLVLLAGIMIPLLNR
ncbi:hypothetical protein [Thalassospira alkalitolerans]|uniref:hypothetical protein n=1 Tax=Thalassospira alkalitolerans TaxID=1293890 RepID=UPI0030EBCC41